MCARRASNVLAGASQSNRRVCCKTKPGGSFPKNAAGGIPGLHGGTRTSEDPSLGDVACDLNCKIIRCVPGSFRSLRAWHRSFHPGSSFRRSFAEGPLGERPPPVCDWSPGGGGAINHCRSVRNGVRKYVCLAVQLGRLLRSVWSARAKCFWHALLPPHVLALPVAAVGGGGNRYERPIRNALRGVLRWHLLRIPVSRTAAPVRTAFQRSHCE